MGEGQTGGGGGIADEDAVDIQLESSSGIGKLASAGRIVEDRPRPNRRPPRMSRGALSIPRAVLFVPCDTEGYTATSEAGFKDLTSEHLKHSK